jgi:hypothetical protein
LLASQNNILDGGAFGPCWVKKLRLVLRILKKKDPTEQPFQKLFATSLIFIASERLCLCGEM